jgi:hypothetical protein
VSDHDELEAHAKRIRESGGSPALKAFRAEVRTKLDEARCSDLKEWAEKRPGEHLDATYGKYPSCALCGRIPPRTGDRSDCPGIVGIGLRGGGGGELALSQAPVEIATSRYGKLSEALHNAAQAAKVGVDTVFVLNKDPNRGFERLLSMKGSLMREGVITDADRVTYLDGAVTVRFKGGATLYLTDSGRRGDRWAKSRKRVSGQMPETVRES